jgi:hypothetical protein
MPARLLCLLELWLRLRSATSSGITFSPRFVAGMPERVSARGVQPLVCRIFPPMAASPWVKPTSCSQLRFAQNRIILIIVYMIEILPIRFSLIGMFSITRTWQIRSLMAIIQSLLEIFAMIFQRVSLRVLPTASRVGMVDNLIWGFNSNRIRIESWISNWVRSDSPAVVVDLHHRRRFMSSCQIHTIVRRTQIRCGDRRNSSLWI